MCSEQRNLLLIYKQKTGKLKPCFSYPCLRGVVHVILHKSEIRLPFLCFPHAPDPTEGQKRKKNTLLDLKLSNSFRLLCVTKKPISTTACCVWDKPFSVTIFTCMHSSCELCFPANIASPSLNYIWDQDDLLAVYINLYWCHAVLCGLSEGVCHKGQTLETKKPQIK